MQAAAEIVEVGGRRYYATGAGVLPSVHTVLDATANNYGLDRWREQVGEQAADVTRAVSIARGNAIEAALERYLLGGDPPTGALVDDGWWSSVAAVADVFRCIDSLELQARVVNPIDGYAGTADARCELSSDQLAALGVDASGPRRVIVDWKSRSKRDRQTGKLVNPTRSRVREWLQQLAAYIDADATSAPRPIGLLVVARPGPPAVVHAITDPDDPDVHRWRERIASFYDTHGG